MFRNAAQSSIGSHMPAKSPELKHTIKLIRELTTEIDELVYAGMSPSTDQSEQLDICYAYMEKRGSKYLRYALYNTTKYV